MMVFVLFSLATLAFMPAEAIEVLRADGNPHTAGAPACCKAQALPPDRFLADAAALEVQGDTFLRVTTHSHAGLPVPVWEFKQPARLSELELPFTIALVEEVDPEGIVEVAAADGDAADSWFPDYAWSHYVVCATDEGAPVHLGWRFTRKATRAAAAGGAGPREFVAMIVRPDQAREAEAARATAARAEAEAESLHLGSARDGDASPREPRLRVGQDAPGWMVAMGAALTARTSAPSSTRP